MKIQDLEKARTLARKTIFEEELVKLRKLDYPIDESWVRQIAIDATDRRIANESRVQ